MGKSAVLRALEATVEKKTGVCIRYEVRSAVDSVPAFLSQIAAQILEQAEIQQPGLSDFRRALNALSRDRVKKILAAAILDGAGAAAPGVKELAKATIAAIYESDLASSTQSTLEGIARLGQEDGFFGLIAVLQALSETGVSGCVLIDRVDAASEALKQTIVGIVANLPRLWRAVICVNDEIPEGLAFLDKHYPHLAYCRAIQVQISPLSYDGLAEWVRAKKLPIDHGRIFDVLESTNGRPLFIQEYEHGVSEEAIRSMMANQLGPYHEQRFRTLSAKARELAIDLSVFPSYLCFPFSFLLALSNLNATECLGIVEELLRQNVLRQEGSFYSFSHELTSRFILSSLPSEVARASAEKILLAMKEMTTLSTEQREFDRLQLLKLVGREADLRESGPTTAKSLLDQGSVEAAIRTIDLLLGENLQADQVHFLSEIKVKAYMELGYYAEALDLASGITGGSKPSLKISLLKGRILLRLNRYVDSEKILEEVLEEGMATESERLRAFKDLCTIMRDKGNYTSALDFARRVDELAQHPGATVWDKCSAKRALARTLAIAGQAGDAVAVAGEAIRLADESGSLRAKGNAFLALGEAQRHNGNFSEAIASYEAARDIGSSISNRDSEIWARLGRLETLIHMTALDEAREELSELERLLGADATLHPLEFLHARLLTTVIHVLESQGEGIEYSDLLQEYQDLGVVWPGAYLSTLVRSGELGIAKL